MQLIRLLGVFLFLWSSMCAAPLMAATEAPAAAATSAQPASSKKSGAASSTSQTSPLFLPEDLQSAATESPDRFVSEFLYMLSMLGLILLILLAVTWFLKKVLNTRLQQVNSSSAIKVIERRSLSPKSAIFLLEVEGRGVALAESTNGVTFLTTFPIEEEEAAPTAAPPQQFSSYLERPKSSQE